MDFKSNDPISKTPSIMHFLDLSRLTERSALLPMINESILTLEEKVSGVSEIDTVMMLGMSHPMGPLQLADFIGLDVCLSILNVMYEGFKNPKYKPNPLLEKMVNDGELGVKSGRGFYTYSGKEKYVSKRFK